MTLVRIKDMDMLVFIQIYDPNMIKQCTYSDNIKFEFLRINTHTHTPYDKFQGDISSLEKITW